MDLPTVNFGLTGITLHHSIQRERTVFVPTEGSTNLGGGNGAGKTSTMKLIPIFWGLDPERTIIKATGNSSFKDHYLPSAASLLVYHYTRDDGPCMAVLYLHGTGKLAYRFVRGTWKDTFYHPIIKPLLLKGSPVNQLFDSLQDLGVAVSAQIKTIIEYRAIIQNNKKLLRRSGKADRSSLQLAQQYCVGHAGVSMQYMDDLCYALMCRKTIFSRLKDMICGTMFEDVHVTSKPEHFKNTQLIDNINSLRDFISNEQVLANSLASHQLYQGSIAELNITMHSLVHSVEVESKRLASLELAHEALLCEEREQSEKYDDALRAVREKEAKAVLGLEQAERSIEDIYAQKTSWEKGNIDKKESDLDGLQGLQAQCKLAKDLLSTLNEKVTQPELKRSEHKIEAGQIRDREKRRLDKESSSLRSQIQKLQDTAEIEKKAIIKARDQALDKHIEEERKKSFALTAELGRLEAISKQNIKTDEELREELLADEALQQAYEKEEDFKEEASVLEHDIKLLELQRRKESTHHEGVREARQQAENKLKEITEQLYPQENTLLAILKNSGESWDSDIGMIINPDLLGRNDLAAAFSNLNNDCYGWELDLLAIDKPAHCENEAYLKAEFEKQELTLRREEEDEAKAEEQLDLVNSACESLIKKMTIQTGKLENARQHREQASNYKKSLAVRINSQASERRMRSKQEWSEKKAGFENWRQSQKEDHRRMRATYDNQINENSARLSIDVGDLNGEIEIISKKEVAINLEYDSQVKIIDKQFSEECQRKGISPEIILEARQRSTELRKKVDEVSGYAAEVAKYHYWTRMEWSRLSSLETKVSQQTLDRNAAITEVARLSKAQKDARNSLKVKKESNQKERVQLSSLLEEANSISIQVGPTPHATENIGAVASLEILNERASNLLTRRTEQRNSVIKSVDKVRSIIGAHPASQINEAWHRLVERRLAQSSCDEHEPAFKLQQPLDIEILWREQLPSIRQTLIETFRAVSDNLDKYYASLKKVNRRVDVISNELGKKINSSRNISTISDIEIILSSSITEDSCWEPLSKFSKHWDIWCRLREKDQLPSIELMELLSHALSSMEMGDISNDIRTLIRLNIKLKENGRPVIIRSDNDMENSSSNGLNLMAMCVVFVGMSRYLCPNPEVTITWPIDELQCLEDENIVKLFEMFSKENIALFSAFPREDHNILKWFANRIFIDPKHGFKTFQAADRDNSKEKRLRLLNNINAMAEE